LEDELRATFAARIAELPVLDDPAGRAIRHASRIRRRQTLLASVAVLVTIGLVGIGVLQVPWQRGETTTLELATAQPSSMFVAAATLGIRLDLRVGNQLWTADGRRLSLPGAGAVTWVYRVPAGWVYGGSAGTLRMLYADGAPANVDVPVDTAVVSADGQRIAWSTGQSPGRVLEFADLSGTGVDTVAKTSLAMAAEPVAIVGSAVVVGLSDGTGYTVWNPSDGFTEDSPVHLAGVYGDGGDGSLLGLDDVADGASQGPPAASPLAAKGVKVGGSDAELPDSGIVTEAATPTPTPSTPDVPVKKSSDGPCLVRYPMAGGRVVRKSLMAACGLGLAAGTAEGSASPDGQWLVAEASTGVMFVSLGAVQGGTQPVVRLCPVRGRSAPVGEDSGTVLVASDEGLVRCGVDGSRREVRIDGLPAGGWSLVPALGGR
jgi:hypothetical protein